MKIRFILHGDTVHFALNKPEISSNPPLSRVGHLQTIEFAENLKKEGKFKKIFCSRLARTSQMAGIIAPALEIDFESLDALGQYAHRSGGKTYFYPGHEGNLDDLYRQWQTNAISALKSIATKFPSPNDMIIIISHRPQAAGILSHLKGVYDPEKIRELALNGELRKKKLWFQVEPKSGKITLLKE